jgi:uncharacterized membrane protein
MMGGYGYGRGGYGGMMGYGGNWLYDLLFFAFAVAILAGLVLLVIWAIRAISGGHGTGSAGPTSPAQPGAGQDEACAIARKRFASGEITKEQYDEICKTLGV